MMKLLTLHLLKKDLMMVLMIGLPCLMLALPVLVVQVGPVLLGSSSSAHTATFSSMSLLVTKTNTRN